MSKPLLINITGPDKPGLASKITSIRAGDKVPAVSNTANRYAPADLFVSHTGHQVDPI